MKCLVKGGTALALATALFLAAGNGAQAGTTTVFPTGFTNEVNLLTTNTGFQLDGTDTIVAGSTAGSEGILDRIYGTGNYVRVDDSSDALFLNFDPATVVAEVKFAGNNPLTFGFFDTTGTFQGVFNATGSGFGTDSGGLAIDAKDINGLDLDLTVAGTNGFTPNGQGEFELTVAQTGSPFTIGITSGGQTFSSDRFANADLLDHMVTFQLLDGSGNLTNSYVLAFEDLSNGGDMDYNDLVVQINNVAAVPEPSTLAMGLTSLALVGGLTWRRRRHA